MLEEAQKVKITIYKQDGCSACEEYIPQVKSLAKAKGASVKVVDVDDCDEKCSWVRYVPAFEVDGKRVEADELFQLLTR